MGVTIDELNEKVRQITELRQKKDELSDLKRGVEEELDAAENRFLELMQENNMQKYQSPFGLVSMSFRTSVRTPKTEEDRALFFQYLTDRGLYDKMITVNSQTLNSFYKAEFEQAREEGKEDFQIPGLNEVTLTPILSLRK